MSEPSEISSAGLVPAPVPLQVVQAPELEAVTPDPLAELSGEEKVEFMASSVLKEENATSSEESKSGMEIFDKAQGKFPTARIGWNTFKQYLSRSVRNPSSQINCLGKKKGYFLSLAAKTIEATEVEASTEPQARVDEKRREKEMMLYDVLLNWLIGQEYRSKITAAGKANGQWGNPDITGIVCDESFGNLWLEMATIEVKLSDKDWKKWIFEAISHRRFANRSYFAFAYPAELIKKLDSDLRYFSELYQIGIVVVAMEQQQYDQLLSGNLKENVKDEEVEIIELYSAPYTPVQPRFQKQYLNKNLKITSTPEVARWGQGLDDDN